jgi:hypothetical protein
MSESDRSNDNAVPGFWPGGAFVGLHLFALVGAIALTLTREESRDKDVVTGVGLASAGLVAAVAALILRARSARVVSGELPTLLVVRDAFVLSLSLQIAPLGGHIVSKLSVLQGTAVGFTIAGFVALVIASAIWRPLVLEARSVVAGVSIILAGLLMIVGGITMVSSVQSSDPDAAQAGMYAGALGMFVCAIGSVAIGAAKIVDDHGTRRRLFDVAGKAYASYLALLGLSAGLMSLPKDFRFKWLLRLHKKIDNLAQDIQPNQFFLSLFAFYGVYLILKSTRSQSTNSMPA